MSWNECLYWYAKDRGGAFFGVQRESEEGALLLEDPKGPILVCTKVTYSGRYGTKRDVSVGTRVELERPYTLRVKKQSDLRRGVSTVLDGLDRGAKLLGRETDLSPDYGAPEVAGKRGIKTDEPEFTRWVLQSRELKALLNANPDFWFQVWPMGPEGLEHLVEVRVSLDANLDVRDEPLDRYGRPMGLERQREDYRNSRFSEHMDALIDLTRAARDAVTAWPMPIQQR